MQQKAHRAREEVLRRRSAKIQGRFCPAKQTNAKPNHMEQRVARVFASRPIGLCMLAGEALLSFVAVTMTHVSLRRLRLLEWVWRCHFEPHLARQITASRPRRVGPVTSDDFVIC